MPATPTDLYENIIDFKESTQKQLAEYKEQFHKNMNEFKTDLKTDILIIKSDIRTDVRDQLQTGISVISNLIEIGNKSCENKVDNIRQEQRRIQTQLLKLEAENEKWSWRSKLLTGGVLSILTAAIIVGIKFLVGAGQ